MKGTDKPYKAEKRFKESVLLSTGVFLIICFSYLSKGFNSTQILILSLTILLAFIHGYLAFEWYFLSFIEKRENEKEVAP